MMTYRRELLIPKLLSDSGNLDFIVTCSGAYNNQYLPYFAFNNTNLNSSDCLLLNSSNGYLKIKMSKSVSINGLLFTSRNADTLANVFTSDYDVFVSNDDNIYTRIVSFGSPSDINSNKEILFPRRKCKYIKVVPKNSTYAAIGELNFYISNEFYLLKQNGKYFSFNPAQYDVTTKQFKETDVAIIKANINVDLNAILSEKYYFTSDMIIGGETFKPRDKFGDEIQFVCVKDSPCSVYGIKTVKEMVVSNTDVSTKSIESINNIKSNINRDEDCKINFVISNDEGKTWKTTIDNGVTWTDLINNISLDTPNNEDWNVSMDKILDKGMSVDSISDINFNSIIITNKIRFAFAISITGFDSNDTLSQLMWNINNVGFLRQLNSNDVDIDLYTDKIKIIPKSNFDELKVNIGTGGKLTVNQINNEINVSSNEEIIDVISEVWSE